MCEKKGEVPVSGQLKYIKERKMKMKGVLAAILTAVLCISSTVLAYSGDGDGTAEYPYQIANKADLLELAADTGNYDKCFILTADIDLAGETFTQAVIAPYTDEEGIQFTGSFDGNGHTIFNLTITASEEYVISLFGIVGTGGQVKNLGVENVNIAGWASVGGLVGANDNGIITACYATGTVTGSGSAGGLVGENSGTLTGCYATSSVSGGGHLGGLVAFSTGSLTLCHATGSVNGTGNFVGGLIGRQDVGGTLNVCYATGSVSGANYVGGLVGENYSGIQFYVPMLTQCYATGSVSGADFVGGLVGINTGGTLTSCYATGSVSGGLYVGGLVGEVDAGSLIDECYATIGLISGNGSVGGLVGGNWGELTNSYATGSVIGTGNFVGGLAGESHYRLTDCYATGSVTGQGQYSYYVGGLVGKNWGMPTNCYATGLVTGTSYVGGLAGDNNSGTFTACFWDINTSATSDGVGNINPDPAGVTGKTTVEMKTLSTFTDAGWDFSATDGDAADWAMPANSYPQLAWPIAGDIAGLYGVNYVDFAVFAAHWEQTDCPDGCENADIDNSGTVNIDDLILFANNWLKGI
jgi:hypothetical protein